MSDLARPRRHALSGARQFGQAMLLTVLLLGVGVAAVVYTLATPATLTLEADKRTAAALAQAKDALIGYAASDANRPGSLPCPDLITNNPPFNNIPNDGSADQFSGTDCEGYVAGNVYLGRLPWRTLGLPDLRDGSGERLWYAVSREFARNPSCGAACPLNSDTAGQLTINGTAPATNVIAIVFSPGAVTGNQVRDVASQNTVGNYLEGENNNGDAVYVTAAASGTFNDRLLPLTREALFPVVEMRVARALRLSLRSYYTTNQFYPFAAPFPGNTATTATYRGYAPTDATPACAPPTPDLAPFLPQYVSPANPGWFVTNNWQRYMVYAVAPRCTAKIDYNISINIALLAPPPPCASGCINLALVQVCLLTQAVDPTVLSCGNTGAGPYLIAGGIGSVQSVVLPASYPLPPQTARPCAGIASCLESVSGNNENTDAPLFVDNYTYVKPVRSATNNDNLIIVGP